LIESAPGDPEPSDQPDIPQESDDNPAPDDKNPLQEFENKEQIEKPTMPVPPVILPQTGAPKKVNNNIIETELPKMIPSSVINAYYWINQLPEQDR
jgi:hypothetical protein